MPITFQREPGGHLLGMDARCRAVAWMPPSTPWMNEKCNGGVITPMSSSGAMRLGVADVEALHLGLHAVLVHPLRRNTMSSKEFANTKLNTNSFRFSLYFA